MLVQNLTKISILLLFLRIFPSKRFRRVTKVAILWMICHTIAFFMAVTLQCLPIRAVSDLTQTGKCIDAAAVVTAGAGFSIFEDIVIILLPVRELKSLQLSLRKRLAVMAMFALGSLYVAPFPYCESSPSLLGKRSFPLLNSILASFL